MPEPNGRISSSGVLRGVMSVGGGGTNNYPDLENKPQINGVELVGDKSLDDLGINIPTKTSDLDNDSGFINSSIVANLYNETSTYAVGAYVTHDNNLYKCNTAITTAEEWNAEHWTLVDVISAIPTKTSELDNDSGFITGDNYYDKSEIDTALSGKADKSDTYTKSQVDTGLSGKADKSDTYTKSQVDTALSAKADKSDTYTKTETDNKIVGLIDDNSTANNKAWSASKIGGELSGKASTGDLALKADKSDTYTKAQTDSAIVGLIDDTTTANNKAWSSSKITDEIINILPTGTASGAVASFNTSLALPLVSIDVDNSATKIYQRGTNLCDEVFELGDISASTGQNEPATTVLRTRDYIPIKPDTQYFVYVGGQSSLTLRTRFYDADKNFIGITQKNGTNVLYGAIFTSPVNAYFLRFTPQTSYGTVYNNNISINYPSSNTAYNAYNTNSSEYATSQLDNINAFVGANNIFADSGDIDVTFKKSIDDAIAELQALILS